MRPEAGGAGGGGGPEPAATLDTLLERAAVHPTASSSPPGAGLRFLDRREREQFLSWAEVRRRALAVAGGLQALGVAPGERVALILPTSPEFPAAFFGAILAGAVPVPLYPPVRLGRLREYHRRTAGMLAAVEARVLLTDRRVARILGETVALARPPLGCHTLGELPRGPARSRAAAPEDLALVQFSSGTTVDPKPVALSHRAVLAQVQALNSFWPDSAEVTHSGVSWLPLYHDMGLIGCIFPALERPTTLTLLPPEAFVARPAAWLRAVSRYRATVSPAPSFAYGLCAARVRDEELAGVDLSCWRVALNGAEPVSPEVLTAFQERFAPWGFPAAAMTPVYGLSEAALAVTFSALDRPPRVRRFSREALAAGGRAEEEPAGQALVSVGGPLPGFEVEVRGEGGEGLPECGVGRVWVRGPSLMEGYLGRPEATARVLRDGWLDTGDLGFLWRGELHLTGRAKDILILRGRNYAPEVVEQAVDGVPGVRTGCAVAVSHLPEGGEGEVLWLFVETAREADAGARAALPEACHRAVLGTAGLAVDRVEVLAPGTLPRTSSGKLRRGEALRLYQAGELAPPEPVTPLRLARAMARSSLAYARLRFSGGGDG